MDGCCSQLGPPLRVRPSLRTATLRSHQHCLRKPLSERAILADPSRRRRRLCRPRDRANLTRRYRASAGQSQRTISVLTARGVPWRMLVRSDSRLPQTRRSRSHWRPSDRGGGIWSGRLGRPVSAPGGSGRRRQPGLLLYAWRSSQPRRATWLLRHRWSSRPRWPADRRNSSAAIVCSDCCLGARSGSPSGSQRRR